MEFYLQDTRSCTGANLSFWKDSGGYTSDVSKAKVYTLEEAQKKHNTREGDDLPLLKSLVDKLSNKAIDHQQLKNIDKTHKSDRLIIQHEGYWDGNDIAFASERITSDKTYNYSHAYSFTLQEALDYIDKFKMHALDIHVKCELDKLVESRFKKSYLNLTTMVKEAGINLVTPKKPKREIFRCEICGKIVSMENFYLYVYAGHPCPKC